MPRKCLVGLLLLLAMSECGLAQTEAASPTVTVRRASFRGDLHVPARELEDFAFSLETTTPRDHDWPHSLTEKVRDFWQQRGYFRAEVRVAVRELPGSLPGASTCDVTFTVSEGARYRLGRITFSPGVRVFSEAELRNLIPLADGDVLNSAKVVAGFDAIRSAYAQRGYAKFSIMPGYGFDEAQRLVYLNMQLFEGGQYRVGKIRFLSTDTALAESLRSRFPLAPGDVFDGTLLESFYRDNDVLLAGKCAKCIRTTIDDKQGTVDVTIDLTRPANKDAENGSAAN